MMFRSPTDGRRLHIYAGPVPAKGPDRKRHFISGSLVAIGMSEAMAAVVAPALMGALLGAGTAALTGGDIGKGALFGAIGGGLGGAIFGAAGAESGSAASAADSSIGGAAAGDAGSEAAVTGAEGLDAGLGTGVAASEGVPTAMTGSGVGAVTSEELPAMAGGADLTASGTAGELSGLSTTPAQNAFGVGVQDSLSPTFTASNAQMGADVAANSAPAGIDQYTWDAMHQTGGALGPSSAVAPSSAANTAGAAGKGILGSNMSKTQLALGALSAGSKLLGGAPKVGNYPLPGPSSTAATQGPYFNQPLQPYTGQPRTPADFTTQSPQYWYTYGTRPEPKFFNGNSLTNFGYAKGGALSMGGQQEYSTGTHGNYVEGPGDGQEDKIPAALSDGEYVVDASTVARLGNGSNRKGALVLDQLRKKIATDAGSREVAQNRINPNKYMKGALSRAA